jgi:hypothetical protein
VVWQIIPKNTIAIKKADITIDTPKNQEYPDKYLHYKGDPVRQKT